MMRGFSSCSRCGSKPLKILVTGGAGFIGSNFIRYILAKYPSYSVTNFDKLTYAGNLANLAGLESNRNYRFLKGDICGIADVEEALRDGVDAVVHFAAESHVDRSIADARAFVETNVQGTFNLLDLARRRGISRFVHISTDEVYGSLAPGVVADERAPLGPASPCAASKAASDMLAQSFWHTYRFPVVITRASNNFGRFQFPEKFVPLMITNALEGKKLPVYGDGMNERDWIHVEDHCCALDRVLHAGRPGEVYNIGCGQPVTNLALVRRILKILGKPEDSIEFVADRPGHDRRYALDATKITGELGWKPVVSFEDGLTSTIEWYRTNPDWVRKAKSGEYHDYYEKFYLHRESTLEQI